MKASMRDSCLRLQLYIADGTVDPSFCILRPGIEHQHTRCRSSANNLRTAGVEWFGRFQYLKRVCKQA